MPTPASILKDSFGYDTFRPLQREVIENVLARRDTLAVMPTGGGRRWGPGSRGNRETARVFSLAGATTEERRYPILAQMF